MQPKPVCSFFSAKASNNKFSPLAISLHPRLQKSRFSSSSSSSSSSSQWFSLLRHAISTSDLLLGKSTHARILHSSQIPDRFLTNNLMSVYARCGSLVYARRLFDKMPVRDLVSWNSILASYAHSGEDSAEHVKEGFCLFRALRESIVYTSRLTLAPVLKLSLSAGYVWALETVHGYAVKIGLLWDEYVSGALVNIYSKFGKIREAEFLFDARRREILCCGM